MTYESMMNHIRNECKRIKGECGLKCGENIFRNQIEKHKGKCPKILELKAYLSPNE